MKYEYWFSGLVKISNREKRLILEAAGTEEDIFKMPEYQIKKLHMIPQRTKEILLEGRKQNTWEREYESFQKMGIRFISFRNKEYPKRLNYIYNPPYCLYVKGRLPLPEQKSVAVVGARSCSEYGRAAAEMIGKKLAEAGMHIISGMAYGIDTAAHKGALSAKGATSAVLGCGADVCYPAGNRSLYQELEHSGGIISEFPVGTTPRPCLFPMRNRIISGLSDCVIVVEAKKKSGSLITADCALEQGKDVYAVPGRISDSLSDGTNWLLAQGAGIFYSVEEFLKIQGVLKEKQTLPEKIIENGLEKNERLVYSVLDFTPKHLEIILEETGLSISEITKALFELEKSGYIKETCKNYFIKCGFNN